MILVDTDVWSEAVRLLPDERVLLWLVEHRAEIAISSVTIGELAFGLNLMPDGRRKEELGAMIERLITGARDRTLDYDARAARSYAEIAGRRRAAGRRDDKPQDAMIAAIAHANGCSVATRNTADFEETGVEVVNPWID